jgi:hypothetical protein
MLCLITEHNYRKPRNTKICVNILEVGRDSLVGTAAGYGLDGPGRHCATNRRVAGSVGIFH